MKQIIGCMVMFLLFMANGNVFAGEKFMHPSTWGTDPADDHYNTFLEDHDHVCHRGWFGIDSDCNESRITIDGKEYAERSCWYNRHCSANNYYHAGIDYEVPNHEHDPDDYVNGQRKIFDIKQGMEGEELGYHGSDDDIVASNCGTVSFAEETPVEKRFGKVVILRHICDSNTPNLHNLCVQEGDDWVIYSQYSHMSRIDVSVGDTVHRGQKIGEIGGTGGWIHHLHYEMKISSTYHSPLKDYDNIVSEDANGYTTSNPTNFGYRNPALFINTVKAVCADDDNGDNDSGNSTNPQIFTEGNHTHIIADDYRCSKETNGPILCWEPGGDGNCWDAWKWYHFNGDVYEVADYHNDPNWITSLSRDYTCNEVYGSGNSGDGTGTGTPETGSEGEETQSSDLTIISCKVRINTETGFQHEIQKPLRPNEFFTFDAEGKVKNKGNSTSYNADLDYRIDHHKDRFDENDTNLGDDEIDISPGETVTEYKRNIKVTVSSDGKSITVSRGSHQESFPVVNGVASFYIFLDVEDDNDKDISSQTNKDEYAKVIINVYIPRDPKYNSIASETLRFYNTRTGSHFFSVNHSDRNDVPSKWPEWRYEDPSFIAFKSQQPNTIPLYTCWNGHAHDYVILEGSEAWHESLGFFKNVAGCTENPWVLFYVYPTQKPNTKPVYLMTKQVKGEQVFILSNGEQDAHFLKEHHNFNFTGDGPMFWSPNNLEEVQIENSQRCQSDLKQCPDGSYVNRNPDTCEFYPCHTNTITPVQGFKLEIQ